MTCKQSIISLLDELLRLFEYGDINKLVYRRLIHLRHKIRNIYESDTIYNACDNFYSLYSKRLFENDISVFATTPYFDIIDSIWNELSLANKTLIWKWSDKIIDQIMLERVAV